MTDDELAALDAAQMKADMDAAQIAPNVWHFQRAHNCDEAAKVEAYLTDLMSSFKVRKLDIS